MSAASRPVNVVALVPFDGIVEDKAAPLVPDGQYLVSYVSHEVVELAQFRGATKLFIKFKLWDAGEHTGTVLFRAFRVKRRIDGKRFVVSGKSELMKAVCRVLDRPVRPDRFSMADFKHCLLRVTTRTVTKDGKQRDLPLALHYSVIDQILGREAGGYP